MDRNICELVQLSVRETKHMKIEGKGGGQQGTKVSNV